MRPLPLLLSLAFVLLIPASASALTVSKAELSGGQLRLEGSNAAPGIFIIASSSTSSAGSRAGQNGAFKIEATGFSSPDCTVIVSDRQTPIATAKLSGCTPAAVTPPPTTPPPPTGSCVINPGAAATIPVGQAAVYNFTTTGCTGGPLQWSLVAGAEPPGMDPPIFQGQTAGHIIGTPTTQGTYTFTVKAVDANGASDTETFTITVTAPTTLAITTASPLPSGQRGHSYQVGLAASGGLAGYLWTLRSGTLPPGLRLAGATGNQLAGTPTTRGTYSFTVRVTDSLGATADKTFSITIG
jgi:hypothetical protein